MMVLIEVMKHFLKVRTTLNIWNYSHIIMLYYCIYSSFTNFFCHCFYDVNTAGAYFDLLLVMEEK